MATLSLPSCLYCGEAMTITTSSDLGVGLVSFQRQHLVCRNCGDVDSRVVVLSSDNDRNDPLLVAVEPSSSMESVPKTERQEVPDAAGEEFFLAPRDGLAKDNEAFAEPADVENAAGPDVEEPPRIENAPPLCLESSPETVLLDSWAQPVPTDTEPRREGPPDASIKPTPRLTGLLESYLVKWRRPPKND
jgi:hypothetical protein